MGKPLLFILPVFVVLFVAGWRHSDTGKKIGGWIGSGMAALVCAVLLAAVLAGYTRPVGAAVATATNDVLPIPPGTLSRNQSAQCVTALGTCNGTSQCCYGHMCYNGACQAP